MGEGHNFKQLKEAILALSSATDWEIARKEWKLVDIAEADEPQTCECGHFPIVEICTIKNRVTGLQAKIGNRCVKRFLGLRSDLIFTAINRIRKDIGKSLNADAIVFFHEHGVLNAWEHGFLNDTISKRSLTGAQLTTRTKLNKRVIDAVARRGFRRSC